MKSKKLSWEIQKTLTLAANSPNLFIMGLILAGVDADFDR